MIRKAMGSHQGQTRYNPACDFNHDGKVNIDDFMIWKKNLGENQQDKGKKTKAKTKSARKLSLKFSPNYSIDDVKLGEELSLDILISGARNSWGGEIHLKFDPEVLEVATIRSGDWETWEEFKNEIDF